jgi:ribosomal protein S18 acetylase RimI-like enzyme
VTREIKEHELYIITENAGASWLKWRLASGDTIEIYDLHVDASVRRQGIGRKMVNELLNGLDRGTVVWAMTRHSNYIAQEFYEEMRFKVIGVLRNIYTDKGCAIVYARRVKDES